MAKITAGVRFRGTAMEGRVARRLIHNGEAVYLILWDCDADIDPRPYRPEDLEPLEITRDRQNLQIIKRAHAMDRKDWEERVALRGTVESREQFRSDTFERI